MTKSAVFILAVVGARPNFMKIAPLVWEARKRSDVKLKIVHTGQHYDKAMSDVFFEELGISEPDFYLGVGSGSHAVQTADIMRRFEPVVLDQNPDVVLVVGDVNSTVACALVSAKLGVPVAHVEAGLRSFDRAMPEEINRILTDAISDWLFVTEPSGMSNLAREGVPENKLYFVGNVMIDTLVACRQRIAQSTILARLGLQPGQYAVLTLHRPANVDDPKTREALFSAVDRLQRETPIVFPVHPRTRALLQGGTTDPLKRLILVDPLGYLDFMKLVSDSRLVLTDSGGVQEESTYLGVPCLTMRESTERPVTIEEGTNRLVGTDPAVIIEAGLRVLKGDFVARPSPARWDGKTARRILDILAKNAGC